MSSTPTTKPTSAPTQLERKTFERQRFYCGNAGHMRIECRAKQRDEANDIIKEDVIKTTRPSGPDKPKYNPKLVCHVCRYTGQSARERRHRSNKREQFNTWKNDIPHEYTRRQQKQTSGLETATTTAKSD